MNTQQTYAMPVGLHRKPIQHAAQDTERAKFVEDAWKRIRERKGGKK